MARGLRLADLVTPQSDDEFLRATYGRSWAVYKGAEDRFNSLANWETLNTLLATQRFEFPRFRVARAGEVIPVECYTELVPRRSKTPYRRIIVSHLLDELRKGASLTVDRVDHANQVVRQLTARLETELRAEVSANMFASWMPVPGFKLHWDDQDSFAIQLAGRKQWRIFEPTRPWPLIHDAVKNAKPEDPPVAEFDLTAGDVLYLPHGWWHSVCAVGEPSLHLTIGVAPDSGLDFMKWLVDRATAHEIFRRRVPRHADEQELEEYLAAIRNYWNQSLQSIDVVKQFFTYTDGTSLSLPLFDLPELSSSNTVLNRKEARIVLLASRAAITPTDSGFVLTALRRRWAFPEKVRPLIEKLLFDNNMTVGQVVKSQEHLSQEQASDILSTLLRAGVIALQ